MPGVSHVEMNVADLARSVEFWGWLLPRLGFEPYQVWDEGRSYKCGDTYLVFVQSEPQFRDQQFHRKRPGLNHIALLAKSREQVLQLPEVLHERGVPVLYEDRAPDEIGHPSEWSVFFEDPDRIKVEVVAPEE
jgi:catechol 2,3-dioxygenase-like lactoylglutathione lyase family enzyme